MARPFRVEIAEARRLAESSPMTHQVETILKELHSARPKEGGATGEKVDNAIALWSGVDDIQKRIDVTKNEIGQLYARNAGDQSNTRAAEELRAVVEGTEMATDTILAAAETIDTTVMSIMDAADDDATREQAQIIADNVIQIFEACNFQDITGQRISKVVESLQFIEERIASMVDVWKAQELSAPVEPKREKTDKDLLNGPALEGDYGVVNQDDVDALFS